MSREIKIHKRGNFQQLRILFPDMLLYTDDSPAYGRKVFFTASDRPSSQIASELLLVNTTAGINVENPKGLGTFLAEVEYMSQSKIDRLIEIPLAKEEQVKHMYQNAISLKIANKIISQVEESWTVLNFLEKPFKERIQLLDSLGYEQMLVRILNLLENYHDKENRSMSANQISRLAYIMRTFDYKSFASGYSLSDNSAVDIQLLMTYFRH